MEWYWWLVTIVAAGVILDIVCIVAIFRIHWRYNRESV